MIQPDWGLLTHIGQAHNENFDSVRSLVREKLLLFKDCKRVIYCQDEEPSAGILAGMLEPKRLLAWSCNDLSARTVFSLNKQKDYADSYLLWGRSLFCFTFCGAEPSIKNAYVHYLLFLLEQTDFALMSSQ